MSLRVHASWSAAAAVVLIGSRFALNAVLARRLVVDVYGQFAYAQWLVEFCFLLLTLGATGAVSRYAAEYRGSPARRAGFFRAWRPFSLLLPVAAGLASVAGAALAGLDLPVGAVICLATWTCLSGLWAMQTAALTGLQRFDVVFRTNTVAAGVMLGGAIFLPFDGGNPTVAFALMGAASAVAFVVGRNPVAEAARGPATEPDAREYRRLRRYAFNIWFTAILWNLAWSRGEMPIVEAYLGAEGVAHYAVAMTLMGGAIAGVSLGISGLAPQVTRLMAEDQHSSALHLCRKVGDVQLLASGILAMFLIWLAPELLRVAFGEDYVGSARLLSILALTLPTVVLSLNNHYLQMVTDSRFNRNATIGGLFVLYTLAFSSVQHWGIDGVATARVAALWVMAALTAEASRRYGALAGLPLANLIRASLLVLLAAVIILWEPALDHPSRIGGFATSSLCLFFVVRAPQGGSVALSAWKNVTK